MKYLIRRGEQEFGPYAPEDIRNYLATGNIVSTDLAREENSAEWVAISAITETAMPTSAIPALVAWPIPPYLPWVVLAVLNVLIGAFFAVPWNLTQAWWAGKADPTCRAFRWYSLAAPFGIIFGLLQWTRAFHLHLLSPDQSGLSGLLLILYAIFSLLGRFELKAGIKHVFGDLGLPYEDLSVLMTWFFGSIYLQFHMNRLRELYEAGGASYRPGAQS